MEKTTKLGEVYIGMKVEHPDMVEDDSQYSRRWVYLPLEKKWMLVTKYEKPAGWGIPTKDPKGVTVERDRWHLDPKTKTYVKGEDKLDGKPLKLGEEPGRLGVLAMVAAAVFVLWYFLLGGVKRG